MPARKPLPWVALGLVLALAAGVLVVKRSADADHRRLLASQQQVQQIQAQDAARARAQKEAAEKAKQAAALKKVQKEAADAKKEAEAARKAAERRSSGGSGGSGGGSSGIYGLPAGLNCSDMRARGFGFDQALAYYRYWGGPSRMDLDGDGWPCETVWPGYDNGSGGGPPSFSTPPGTYGLTADAFPGPIHAYAAPQDTSAQVQTIPASSTVTVYCSTLGQELNGQGATWDWNGTGWIWDHLVAGPTPPPCGD